MFSSQCQSWSHCLTMLRSVFCFCMCFAVLAASDDRDSKVVKITQGPLRGYKDPELGIYAFHSIPYATAPTGVHRFKAPLPPPTWITTRDATDEAIACPQGSSTFSVLLNFQNMQEDCLIANVYIPDTDEKNLPVMVYIHGGAFQFGSGNSMIPKKLVPEHNIILVTFNYRLGIHGFLCLGTEDAPGNAGMKDQVELLRWVKRNIAFFGGNPDDVTIGGCSAGSISADLLMLSKSAEGLFNKVVPESGVGTAGLSIQSDPLENAKWFAKTNNFDDVDDIHALEQFYKTASYEMLINDTFFYRPDSTFVFVPCVERASKEAFLVESPIDILKNNAYKKVPVLHGFADMEGLLRVDVFEDWKNKMNENFSDFLSPDLKFESKTQREEVAKSVKEFYFGDKPVGNDNAIGYVDYFTDVMFAYPTLRSIKLMVENNHDQIYLYEYSYVDEKSPVVPYTDIKGANHCFQAMAKIGSDFPGFFEGGTSECKKMGSTLRQMWANFIKKGKPVLEESDLPAWPVVGSDRSPHMSLGNTLELRGPLLERRARFWDAIYAKHYRNPIPPPAPIRHSEL